jgi:hypothetical protein
MSQVTSFVDLANRIDELETTLVNSQKTLQESVQALSSKLQGGQGQTAQKN